MSRRKGPKRRWVTVAFDTPRKAEWDEEGGRKTMDAIPGVKEGDTIRHAVQVLRPRARKGKR